MAIGHLPAEGPLGTPVHFRFLRILFFFGDAPTFYFYFRWWSVQRFQVFVFVLVVDFAVGNECG